MANKCIPPSLLRLSRAARNGLIACVLFGLSGCGKKDAAAETGSSEQIIKTPATVAQAAQVLDLSTLPLVEGAKPSRTREVASVSYLASGDVKKAFESYQKTLAAKGWKELPNSSVTPQSASGMFARSGFVISLSAFPNGQGDIMITLQNHGNIRPGQLPVPAGTKPVYVGDSAAMYVTEAGVPETATAVRDLFLSKGWIPYGGAGDSVQYKQNAILINTTVSSAPAQGGKTMISYTGTQISSDIPAPPDAADLRYSDQPPELTFESTADQAGVIDFYRKTLAATGWESTLDHVVEISDRPTMILRNPAKDMLTLSFSSNRRGKLPVSMRFQSAAEIAELDRRIKEEAPALRAALEAKEKKEAAERAEANKPLPKIPITPPADAQTTRQSANEITFTVGNGKAKAAAATLGAQLRDAGWKEDASSLDPMAGMLSLSRERQSITIHYTDTGVMAAELSVSAMGAELEAQPPK